MKSIREFFCKHLGHNWNYFEIYNTHQIVRCCSRCHGLQYRIYIAPKKNAWTFAVQYTDNYARNSVDGYNEN
jgi:hypothetical protein